MNFNFRKVMEEMKQFEDLLYSTTEFSDTDLDADT
jgi:hypothetical protein